MRNFMNTSAFLLLILLTAGNVSICSGKGLPVCLSRDDSIPRSRDGIITPDMAYMYVQEKMDGTCHAVYDNVLRIHYEEPYAVSNSQRLRFKVYDKYRNVVIQTDDAGNITDSICGAITQSPVITTGENWLEINFWCFNLYEGEYYYLEVWNGKGEKGFLRFKVMPS